MTSRDRRALGLLVAALLLIVVLRFGVYGERQTSVVAPTGSVPLAEKRLDRLRRIASTVPGRETALAQVRADLAAREKGILSAQTSNQAQAHLLETLRRIGSANGLQVRGGELLPPHSLESYGEVGVAVTFEAHIDQLVNFLADLTKEPELIATREMRISAGNAKEKTVIARIAVSGVVPRKLIPEKKGIAQF